MQKFINKRSSTYDYRSRYTGVPYFYDTTTGKDTPGIPKQIKFDTPFFWHRVAAHDTLDKLALKYYNNPTLWWVIAYFNKINDPFIDLVATYRQLKIPTVNSIVFED